MKLGEVAVPPCVLQLHEVSSKLDEKQKSFINSPFFVFLIHLFLNSLIFANSLFNDSALGARCLEIRHQQKEELSNKFALRLGEKSTVVFNDLKTFRHQN